MNLKLYQHIHLGMYVDYKNVIKWNLKMRYYVCLFFADPVYVTISAKTRIVCTSTVFFFFVFSQHYLRIYGVYGVGIQNFSWKLRIARDSRASKIIDLYRVHMTPLLFGLWK